MGRYPLNRYIPGTYKRECDICGMDFLRKDMMKDHEGRVVDKACYDPEHPRKKKRSPRRRKPLKRD